MSIRLRLTLWYSFVLAALLIVLGVAIYSILSNNLRANIDSQLNNTADEILNASHIRLTNILEVVIPEDLDIFRASGVGVLVIDRNGAIVRRSSNLGALNQVLDPASLPSVTPSINVNHDVQLGGVHLRVLTVSISIAGEQVGYVQVAASLESVDQSLQQLGAILLLSGIFAVVAAALVGAFLARQALRPIDRITQTALSIARAGKLDQRIPATTTHDEVGRLSETFNLMLDRLEGLFGSQQRFIADVSHELRTPLTTIRGNIDLLKRIGGADPASLDAIRSESDRMIRLVGDLLLLAQADGGLPMRREPVDLDRIAADVVQQVQVIAGRVRVVLRISDDEEPISVMGDADRLRQLVLNLVDNAIKYTPAGGEVVVTIDHTDGWARLDVSDTGPGIPPEHLQLGPNGIPLIFERFYRVEKSRARMNGRSGGTGLGLSIAYWIVQMHAGRIDVHSEIDTGTTFTVWLPRRLPILVQADSVQMLVGQ
jgi:two-component system, OmpR family, sensor kinase